VAPCAACPAPLLLLLLLLLLLRWHINTFKPLKRPFTFIPMHELIDMMTIKI
jgi:hypothetical protein